MAKYTSRNQKNNARDTMGDTARYIRRNDSAYEDGYDNFRSNDSAYEDGYDDIRRRERKEAAIRERRVRQIMDEDAYDRRRPPVKKKKHTALIVILVIVILIAAAGTVFGINAKAEVNDLKSQAYVLKDELKETLDDVKDMDTDAAEEALGKVRQTSGEIRETLKKPFWKMAAFVPVYGQDVKTAKDLLDVLDTADKDILTPFLSLLKEHPLSELKETENGLNVGIITSYLDFLDEAEPAIRDLAEKIQTIKFNTIDMDIDEYAEKFTTLFDALNSVSDYKDLLQAFIGRGEDKLYLVMAQNSAEIRAAGGFPGSMGMIHITDGILSIDDFSSIVNYVYQANTPEAGITDRESELFQYMYTQWAHDACYNPHFSRVAEITKAGYEVRHGEQLDGIISVTPAIIQEILNITGEEIYLDDGTILTGDNATAVIQRDLYLKYQNDDATANDNNNYIDPLFAQTAKQAIGLLFKGFSMDKLSAYMDFFKEGCADRTMMLWFADEEEEDISIRSGCSGNLNADPEKPEAGVYFSCCDASKLGMFAEIDTEISDPVTNAADEQEYTVTVRLNNYLDEYSIAGFSSSYLIGTNAGAIQSYVYFFAPAGGTVSDFETSNGMEVQTSEYENLQVGYLIDLFLNPGEPVTISYKVTTAPGVTTPLTISSTPTLQEYK